MAVGNPTLMPLLPAASIKAIAMQSDNKRLTTRGSSTNDESPPERIRPKYPSAQKRKAALALFEAGTGYKSAAALLGLSVYTVRDWHRKFKKGTFHVELNPKQYRHTPETKARVIALRESGCSWREVSTITGVNISTCRSWLEEN